jgi:uncharacterized protein (DUF983 family)
MMDNTWTTAEDLPFVLRFRESQDCDEVIPAGFQAGDVCPICMHGRLDFNGLLNLECEECKFSVGGSFT